MIESIAHLSIPVLILSTCAYLLVQRSAVILIGMAYAKSQRGQSQVIYKVPLVKNQFVRELKQSHWTFVFDSLVFAALIHFALISTAAESTGKMVLTVAAHFIFFELYFYLTHRALHTKAFYWIHRAHHVAHVAQPITSASFSFLERVILFTGFMFPFVVITAIFGSTSLIAIAICLLINDVFNIFGHLNIEFYPKILGTSFMRNILNSPTGHAMHHARFDGNYGLISSFFDVIFKTRFKDNKQVFMSTNTGTPMTSLHQNFLTKSKPKPLEAQTEPTEAQTELKEAQTELKEAS